MNSKGYYKSSKKLGYLQCLLYHSEGATVAQWVKRGPTDLADRVRSPLEAKSSQPFNEVPLHTVVHYYPNIILI